MRYGTVIQYFPAKGFGFIKPDAGPDVYFHITALGACQAEPEIKRLTDKTVALEVDLSDWDAPAENALKEEFEVTGVPTMIFIDQTGVELRELRLEGLIPSGELAARMDEFLTKCGVAD